MDDLELLDSIFMKKQVDKETARYVSTEITDLTEDLVNN